KNTVVAGNFDIQCRSQLFDRAEKSIDLAKGGGAALLLPYRLNHVEQLPGIAKVIEHCAALRCDPRAQLLLVAALDGEERCFVDDLLERDACALEIAQSAVIELAG